MDRDIGISLDARVRPVDGMGRVRAYATLAFSAAGMGRFFVVNGVKVVEGAKGLFVGMPSSVGKGGAHRDICHPATGSFRNQVNEAVLSAYSRAIDEPAVDTETGESAVDIETGEAADDTETGELAPDTETGEPAASVGGDGCLS